MRIVNDTPYKFAPVAGRMVFPGHTCTLVVKGTFDLVPDGVASIAKEQPFPTGDEPYDDDEEAKGSVRYANDLAPFKPCADVLCVGSFHAPGGTPVLQGRAGFSVGPMSRTLLVHGDRHWSGTLSLKASAALKIAKMEVRYENAYGGVGHGPNPVGRGYRKEDAEAGGKQRALANLEELDDPARSARRKISPASFGPIAMTWEPRSKKLGTYKKKWLETRWPWFAEDIDWTYFNAAPESQQLLGYLRGDEEVVLENMHPEHPSLRTRLPATRVRCFLDEDGAPDRLREVEMRLDTLWIDADAGKLVLVWRGVAEVADADHKEVRRVFVHAEPLDEPEHGDAHYLAQFHAAIAAIEAEFEGPSETDTEEPPAEEHAPVEVAPAPPEPSEADLLVAEGHKKAEAELESLASGTRLPDPTPASLALLAEHYAAQGIDAEHLFKQAEGDPPEEEVLAAPPGTEPWTRERVVENLHESGALRGADLSGLDLAGLKLAGVELVDANLQSANLSGSDLTGADLSGANLSGANLRGTTLRATECSGANLDDADLSEAQCEAAVFENASLVGATMHRLAASRADFSGATLTNAGLTGSNLTSANMSRADLTGADLREAVLKNTEVGGAKLVRANLMGADLTGLRANGADFSEAQAGTVQARGAIFEDAVLDRADFKFADLTGALLMRAHAEETDFSAATLKGARFARAQLRAAKFVRADLYEAILEQANLTDVDATGANMYCAEFLDAVTDGLRLDGAYLAGTKLDT